MEKNIFNQSGSFKKYLPFFVVFLLFFQNCKTSKLLPNTTSSKVKFDQSVFQHIDTSLLNFKYLASKINVKASLNGKQQNFNANMRWKKNEIIWLSFSIFGFEGVRVSITPDSLKIIDRLNRQYYEEPFSYINEKAGFNITFNELENILVGKTIKMDTKKATYSILPNGDYQIMYNDPAFSNITKLDSNKLLPIEMKINDISGKNLHVNYNNYMEKAGKLFSMNRMIIANDLQNRIEIEAKYEQIEIKDFLEFPFQINQSFTRVH